MAGHFPPAAELTTSGRPVLLPTEIECSILSSVDLDCDDISTFPLLKSGIIILTTHRLVWISDSTNSSNSAVAVPLSAVSHILPSKKSIKAIFASPRVRFQVSFPSGGVSRSAVITIVIRGKGDHDVFVSKFWENWRARAWENDDNTKGSSSASASAPNSSGSGGFYSSEGTVRMVGVSGILRKEQEMWENTDRSLQDAFQDLNALMVTSVRHLLFCNVHFSVAQVNESFVFSSTLCKLIGVCFSNLSAPSATESCSQSYL